MKEKYSPGYTKNLISDFKQRKVEKEASFFYPLLSPNMNILDCGCGPGTISIGLSRCVLSGKVIGIDIEKEQIEIAKKIAEKEKITNIEFFKSNIYKLPFENNSFDAVFAHAILQHLRDPQSALKEIYRVLKPGGFAGIRDDDSGGLIITPYTREMYKVISLLGKYMEYNGGNPRIGRKHRELLDTAGFKDINISATCSYDSDISSNKKRSLIANDLLIKIQDLAIKQNWVTEKEYANLIKVNKDWSKHPHAFNAIIWCEAIGYKKTDKNNI